MRKRFVILEHDHPLLHWDLLIEHNEFAFTWRLLSFPVSGAWLPTERIADHRVLYLDYEGVIGGDRGSVRRLFSGTCESAMPEPPTLGDWWLRVFDCPLGTAAVLRCGSACPDAATNADKPQPISSVAFTACGEIQAAWQFCGASDAKSAERYSNVQRGRDVPLQN